MKTLTPLQLVNLVTEIPGAFPVGLVAYTDTKALKTGNPFPDKLIFKRIRCATFVGAKYNEGVKREAGRQDGTPEAFEAEALPWGTWYVPNKVIQHKGEFYLRTQSTPGQRRTVEAKLLGYFDKDGKTLTPQQVKPFIKGQVESVKQQNYAQVVETVWVRTYKISSLERVRVQGVTYRVNAKIQATASLPASVAV